MDPVEPKLQIQQQRRPPDPLVVFLSSVSVGKVKVDIILRLLPIFNFSSK